ncbi:hypothetical protein MRB53_015308 [Persea americana]|uniref:Uncharacterized protein n=1 Tax=Persea americana TaxID=3435 RepID=A0ACC2KDB2_PERAE|nr:hypothetical protein MRB53_015308 [Persea americana]
MGSLAVEKPHAVCIPYPAQGHINPMLKLAKLLHFRGFHITFVNTEFNHRRLLKSRGPDSLTGLEDFRFETIPDGLPSTDKDATQDIPALCDSTSKNCLVPFRKLVEKLNGSVNMPPVSCIVSDGVMSFTMKVAEELCIPEVLFWTTSACGFMGYLHYRELVERGLVPLKDESYLTNGYLDTRINWIKGMEDIRLRDLPSFVQTTDPNDLMFNFAGGEAQKAFKSSALILNTFHDLEDEVLTALTSMFPHVYSIGSLSLLLNQIPDYTQLKSIGSNLWKEETECLEWLDTKEPGSVVYVNFGSITVMTPQQLSEFAWGLANSNHPFLWVIRPDLVTGDSAMLPDGRLLKSRGLDSLKGLHDFRFETIPDGLPSPDLDATQDIPALCDSTRKYCLVPFRNLVVKLNGSVHHPRVSCIVSDGAMCFTLQVAEVLHIPEVLFWTTSACGFMGFLHYRELVDRGLVPLKDESYFANGYLDTRVKWIKGTKDNRLRDLLSFIQTTDPNDIMLNFAEEEAQRSFKASAVILNAFHDLEHEVLTALTSMFPHIYSIGSLCLLLNQTSHDTRLKSIRSNLWKEETECLEWLDRKEPGSVVYVDFGSITVMTPQQLTEFAWGLANSNHPFLWVIRPDLVEGDSAMLPDGFVEMTQGRGLLASWCPQEEVLAHRSVGGFLTHCGWNSTLESNCAGVPVICRPFFAEQQTNCWFVCSQLGLGMEIDSNVKRDTVEGLVRELMNGDEGREMRKLATELKEKAENAGVEGVGSSFFNLEKVVDHVMMSEKVD